MEISELREPSLSFSSGVIPSRTFRQEKKACRLAVLGLMSRFCRPLEGCMEAIKNVFLLNDFKNA